MKLLQKVTIFGLPSGFNHEVTIVYRECFLESNLQMKKISWSFNAFFYRLSVPVESSYYDYDFFSANMAFKSIPESK